MVISQFLLSKDLTDIRGSEFNLGFLLHFITIYEKSLFMPPEGTSGGILKSHGPSVHPSLTNHVSAIAHKTTEANLNFTER